MKCSRCSFDSSSARLGLALTQAAAGLEERLGIFDRWFGKGDPTRKWVANRGLALDFDFGTHALCGVPLGAPLEQLAKLGPAENSRAAQHGDLCYYSKGFEVGTEEGVIKRYALIWRDSQQEGYQPFAGACRDKGRPLLLNAQTTEREINAYFGAPYWRHREEAEEDEEIEASDLSETTLFYELGDVERMVSLTHDGRLLEIEVIMPPSLADEARRKFYGITKAWPPPR